eukprot:13773456-Alexandrium_andersonii.AAC.1
MDHGVLCEFYRGPLRPALWCRVDIPVSPSKDVRVLATEKRRTGSVAPQPLVALLDVARPSAPGFKCQAYGRD